MNSFRKFSSFWVIWIILCTIFILSFSLMVVYWSLLDSTLNGDNTCYTRYDNQSCLDQCGCRWCENSTTNNSTSELCGINGVLDCYSVPLYNQSKYCANLYEKQLIYSHILDIVCPILLIITVGSIPVKVLTDNYFKRKYKLLSRTQNGSYEVPINKDYKDEGDVLWGY